MLKNRMSLNTLFLCTLGVVLLLVIVSWGRADVQNRQLYQDYIQFESAKQYLQQTRYEEAEHELKSLLKHYRSSYLVHLYYAICLEEQGRNQDAIREFETVNILRPAVVWDPIYLFYYGKTLMNTGLYDKAEQNLRRVIRLDQDREITRQTQELLNEIQDRRKGL